MTYVPPRPLTDTSPEGKVCPGCGLWNTWDGYPRSKKFANGHASRCKGCTNARNMRHWRTNHAVVKEQKRRSARSLELGLAVEVHDALKAEAAGRCAACGRPGQELMLDHNHATGRNRGFLCNGCNSAVGMAGESPVRLIRLARWLAAQHQVDGVSDPDVGLPEPEVRVPFLGRRRAS